VTPKQQTYRVSPLDQAELNLYLEPTQSVCEPVTRGNHQLAINTVNSCPPIPQVSWSSCPVMVGYSSIIIVSNSDIFVTR